MVPKLAARGRSFRGVFQYVLHDKNQAQTAERLAWWHTENLATNDPERAWRLMAHTALHAETLRQQTGNQRSGRKAEKPVFWFSLSWHADQQVTREHMIVTGRSALAALGFQKHQAVLVAHSDGVPHIHVIANSIHPETGLSHTPSYSKLALSKWAQAYEQAHGKIYCVERVDNNARRARGEIVKYEDRKLISQLYHEAPDAHAFKAALEQYGYQVVQGNKLLIVNREGKPQALARQLEDVHERELRAFFKDVELRKIAEETNRKARQREEENTAQRKREAEEERQQKGKRPRAGRQAAPVLNDAAQPATPATGRTQAVRRSPQPEGYQGLPLPQTVVRLENQQRDELAAFYETNRVIRERWQWQLGNRREQERAERLRAQIASYEEQRANLPDTSSRWSRTHTQVREIEDQLINLRAELAELAEREAQRRARDEHEAREHLKGLQGLQERHQRERQQLHADPKALLDEKGREFNVRSAPERRPQPVKEQPLAQVPLPLQARIAAHVTQTEQARRLEQAQTVAANDNARPERQAFNQAAQARPAQAETTSANDNRRAEAQAFNRAAQGLKPPSPETQEFNRAAQGKTAAPPAPTTAKRLTAEQQQFMRTLQEYGIAETDARRLSTEKTEACRAKLPTLPTLLETQDTWNRAGYVRAFIERDYWEAPALPQQPSPPTPDERAARPAPDPQLQPRPNTAAGPTPQVPPRTAEAITPTAEDDARYAILDQWEGQPQQQVERKPTEEQTDSQETSNTYSAEDTDRHSLLDSWNAAQGRDPGPQWSLVP